MKKIVLIIFLASLFFAVRGVKAFLNRTGHTSPTQKSVEPANTTVASQRSRLGLCCVCVVGDYALMSDDRIVKRGDVIDGKKIVQVDERGVHVLAGRRSVLLAITG